MPAIITTNFRIENAVNFINDVANTSNGVYLFIGKSDPWSNSLSVTTDGTPDTPVDDLVDINKAWTNMIAMKQITASNVMNLIPRVNWTSGTSYVAWDDADSSIYSKSFYILTDEFKVYKCIVAGSGASTVKPTQTNTNPSSEGDGYIWKYMFSISTLDANNFLTNTYVPVKTVVIPAGENISDLSSDDQTKYNIQQNSAGNNGKIYRAVVTNGGSGYSSSPTVTIHGDGTGATAQAVVSGGVITAINVTANGSTPYHNAYITITDSTGLGAAARPVLSPPNGHGTDPVRELGAFFTAVEVSLLYADGSGNFIVNNSFRQIGIVKNPYTYGTTTIGSATTYSALKEIQFTSSSGFTIGDYITGASSGTIAYIDSYDSVAGVLKYHQNNNTGYGTFTLGETVNGHTGGTGSIASSGGLINPQVQPYSGKMLFLENRAPINRSASQIENIKLVIEF